MHTLTQIIDTFLSLIKCPPPPFPFLLFPPFHKKILIPNKVGCFSIMWDESSQTNSRSPGNSGMGKGSSLHLSSPSQRYPDAGTRGERSRDRERERERHWQMERERHFVQRYQGSLGQQRPHPPRHGLQNNSSVGSSACLLIKTCKVSHCKSYEICSILPKWVGDWSCLKVIWSRPDLSPKGPRFSRGSYN